MKGYEPNLTSRCMATSRSSTLTSALSSRSNTIFLLVNFLFRVRKCFTISSILVSKNCGTPGSINIFSHCSTGQLRAHTGGDISSVFFTSTFDMWYLHATIIGILFAITSNFFLHKYWTFGDRNFSLKRTIIQYSKFAVLSSVSGLVQIGMVYYFVNEFSLSYPISLLSAVLTAAISNFILNKRLTFSEKVWS